MFSEVAACWALSATEQQRETPQVFFQYCYFLLNESVFAGTPPVGTTISVTEEKGGNITLQCHFKAKKISYISLNSLSENIPVCETEECSGRVFKQGNCDVVFKNLCFSDAGKYMLNIYYHNDQAELERQIRTYQLHIHGKFKTDHQHVLSGFPLIIALVLRARLVADFKMIQNDCNLFFF